MVLDRLASWLRTAVRRMRSGDEPTEALRFHVAAGTVVGVAGALAVTRVLQGSLYDVSGSDPATYIGVVLLLTTVAAVASYLPARRASRVDPMVALHAE